MIAETGDFVGQVCHIEAAEPGGERFNPTMTNAQRAAFDNLMLMCYKHHVVTNDVAAYTVERLKHMKAQHEAAYADAENKLAGGFADLTQAQELLLPRTYAKMREVWDLSENDDIGSLYVDYAQRLQQVTPAARELLLVLSRRSEAGEVRLSELRAVTGTSGDEIVAAIHLLEKHRLASVDEPEYGNDEILRPFFRAKGHDDVLSYLKEFAEKSGRSLDEIVVHLRFDLLD
jgi:hypothetical protein